jgi:hypothetical protein
VIVWSGKWPAGLFNATLEGEGTVDLYLQGTGEAQNAGFTSAVREGTVNLPATHPSAIAVGCTVNRPKWKSISGADVALHVPLLDPQGGLPLSGKQTRDLADGEVCWFSSAGPTVTGVPKPEISAPGGLVIAAMSAQATPGSPSSIFTNTSCPPDPTGNTDPRCLQVDKTHAVAVGTSMSAPLVAGGISLLFQRDATLTQDKVLAALQGGAHAFRGDSPFEDQGGPGELDVIGALDAIDEMTDPKAFMPAQDKSWITLSADYVAADGSTPLTAIVELRTDQLDETGEPRRADMLGDRLQPLVKMDGQVTASPPIQRRGPGVWFYTIQPPAGLGGSSFTLGATLDGEEIVTAKTVPVAADIWTAEYPSHAKGGCAVGPTVRAKRGGEGGLGVMTAAALALIRRRRSGASRVAPTSRRPGRADTRSHPG